ncbi:hypothetical protein J5X84_38725 [Streptosporangiaceae bacterium NEAU-GS5]|nr:hypothetical protein [Streptosporangiaceae bacterium NEAU-GS5]
MPLSPWLIGAALVVALAALVAAIRDRPMRRMILVGLALLELGLVVQAVLALIGLGEVGEKGTFIGYLIGVLAIPPAAVWWGRAEPTRYGTGVIAVAAFTVAVMVGRLVQIWNGS